MANRTAYDRIHESLQGSIFSTIEHGRFRYLLYWQMVPDLENADSSAFRFLNLTSKPIVPVDYSLRDLQDIRGTEISLLKSTNPGVEQGLSEFMQTATTSWPNDISKLVIPEGLNVQR